MINPISMKDGSGNVIDPGYAIFPILKEIDVGNWEIIGTGFYVTYNGVFASAKHVLEDVIDYKTGKNKYPIFLVHFYGNNNYLIRPITQIILSNDADIGLGLPAEFKDNKTGELLRNKVLTLSAKIAKSGDRLATYAYPKSYITGKEVHLWSNYYEGKVTEYYPNGHILLKTACYQTSINLLPGASGGPVFSPDGHVIGVNSAGFSGLSDVSHVSSINSLLQLRISVNGCDHTVRELSDMGYVSLKT